MRRMGLIGQIGLIIRKYESDEEWGLGFDGGGDAVVQKKKKKGKVMTAWREE